MLSFPVILALDRHTLTCLALRMSEYLIVSYVITKVAKNLSAVGLSKYNYQNSLRCK